MEIDTLAIPSGEPLDGEGVSQVIRPRPNSPFPGFQSGFYEQTVNRPVGGADRQPAAIDTDEESSLRASRRIFRPLNQEPVQFAGERAMERNPSGSPLECFDEKNTRTRIHIAHAEAQRFSEAEAGAIEDQH